MADLPKDIALGNTMCFVISSVSLKEAVFSENSPFHSSPAELASWLNKSHALANSRAIRYLWQPDSQAKASDKNLTIKTPVITSEKTLERVAKGVDSLVNEGYLTGPVQLRPIIMTHVQPDHVRDRIQPLQQELYLAERPGTLAKIHVQLLSKGSNLNTADAVRLPAYDLSEINGPLFSHIARMCSIVNDSIESHSAAAPDRKARLRLLHDSFPDIDLGSQVTALVNKNLHSPEMPTQLLGNSLYRIKLDGAVPVSKDGPLALENDVKLALGIPLDTAGQQHLDSTTTMSFNALVISDHQPLAVPDKLYHLEYTSQLLRGIEGIDQAGVIRDKLTVCNFQPAAGSRITVSLLMDETRDRQRLWNLANLFNSIGHSLAREEKINIPDWPDAKQVAATFTELHQNMRYLLVGLTNEALYLDPIRASVDSASYSFRSTQHSGKRIYGNSFGAVRHTHGFPASGPESSLWLNIGFSGVCDLEKLQEFTCRTVLLAQAAACRFPEEASARLAERSMNELFPQHSFGVGSIPVGDTDAMGLARISHYGRAGLGNPRESVTLSQTGGFDVKGKKTPDS